MPSFLDRIKNLFFKTKKLPAPEGEKKDNIDRKEEFRKRIFSIVPGFNGTRTAKLTEIQNIRAEYAQLLEERKKIMATKEEIKEWLGWTIPIKSMDELCQEENRKKEVEIELMRIYRKGKENPTVLSQEELLKFQRMQEYKELDEQEHYKAMEILAVRQGLMNVADTDKSSLDETLQTQYRNAEEFCKNSSLYTMISFIRGLNTDNQASKIELIGEQESTALAPIEDHEMDELITAKKESELTSKAKEALKRSPILRVFYGKLLGINDRTGYTNGENVTVPFKFSASPDLEGEIIIEDQPQITNQQTNGRG